MAIFEAYTEAVSVSLDIPGDITTFGGVSRIASALSMIESMRVEAELAKPKFDLLKGRGYELRSFQVKSPAEITIVADPAWIAVYLGAISLGLTALQTLGSYKQIKEGAKEMSTDFAALRSAAADRALSILEEISGLTERQKQEMEIGAALYLQSFSLISEKFTRTVVRASLFASVVRRGQVLPVISVKPTNTNT